MIKPIVKTFSEDLVLESLETVEQASIAHMDASPKEKINGEKVLSPIKVLGALVVKWRGKQYLGVLFVEVVSLSQDESVKDVKGEMRRRDEFVRELGGSVGVDNVLIDRSDMPQCPANALLLLPCKTAQGTRAK